MSTQNKTSARVGCGRLVRRTLRQRHRMMRIKSKSGRPLGWNYRGYCVYRKHKGNVGCLWGMPDESGDEWAWFFRTLAEFRRDCDRWERKRAKEASLPNTQSSATPKHGH